MQTSRLNILIGSLLMAALLLGHAVPYTYAANEVPVNDAELIDAANDILDQVTKAASEQSKATANQLYAWRNTFKVSDLKKEIVDLFSEKILGYAQRPGVSFVDNWQAYLETAAYKGALNEINNINKGPDFCFKARLVAQLNKELNDPDNASPIVDTNTPDTDCVLQDGSATNLQSFKDDFAGGYQAAEEALKSKNRYTTVYMTYHRRVEAAATLAQRAAEDEALAGGGFLSVKDPNSAADDPAAHIITPGSIVQGLALEAASADLKLAMELDQVNGFLDTIGDSFITLLTDEKTGGLAGLDVCQHLKNRVKRANNAASNSDSADSNEDANAGGANQNTALDSTDCKDLIRAAGTVSATNASANSSRSDGTITADASLLGKIDRIISLRKGAKTIIKRRLEQLHASLNLFDDPNQANYTLNSAFECRPDFYGRKRRTGEPTQAQIRSGAKTMPAGASEVDTGKRFRDGKFRACLTQAGFAAKVADYNDLLTRSKDNADALERMVGFRRIVVGVKPNTPTYKADIARLTEQFNTRADNSNTACAATITESSWSTPPTAAQICYDFAFDEADAQFTNDRARKIAAPPDDTPDDSEGTVDPNA